VSTSDIINIISAAIAAVGVAVAILQYRRSRTQNRMDTSRRTEQYGHLSDLARRARSQAETAQMITNSTVRGVPVNIEDLRALAKESGKLAAELQAEAKYARPVPARRRYASFRAFFRR
jgi:hypothetical protein